MVCRNSRRLKGRFICSRIKKRRKPRVTIVTLKLCGDRKADTMKDTAHVPLRQIAEGKNEGQSYEWCTTSRTNETW